MFALFDDLFLLSAGRTVYFGPAANAHEVRHLSVYFFDVFYPSPILQLTNLISAVLCPIWIPLPTKKEPIRSLLEVCQLRFRPCEEITKKKFLPKYGKILLFFDFFLSFGQLLNKSIDLFSIQTIICV